MDKRTITMRGRPVTVIGKPLAVGVTAPDFTLDNEFNPVSPRDFGSRIKMISIVPSSDTEICDHQTRRFNQMEGALSEEELYTLR